MRKPQVERMEKVNYKGENEVIIEKYYKCNQCGCDELVNMIQNCLICGDDVCYDCYLANDGLCEECYMSEDDVG